MMGWSWFGWVGDGLAAPTPPGSTSGSDGRWWPITKPLVVPAPATSSIVLLRLLRTARPEVFPSSCADGPRTKTETNQKNTQLNRPPPTLLSFLLPSGPQVRENAESVAFYRGDQREAAVAAGQLGAAVAVTVRRVAWQAGLALWQNIYRWARPHRPGFGGPGFGV